jgi:hypothetical protein
MSEPLHELLGRMTEDLLSSFHVDELLYECCDLLRFDLLPARLLHHGEEAHTILQEGHLLLEELQTRLIGRNQVREQHRQILVSRIQLQLT